MNIAKGCTVTFDKGCCNYAVFGDFCRDKIFFVTRLKENAQYRVIEEHESRNKHITFDRTIEFTGMQTDRKCRKNTNPDCADCVSSVHETAAAVYIWRQKLYKLYVGIKSLPF